MTKNIGVSCFIIGALYKFSPVQLSEGQLEVQGQPFLFWGRNGKEAEMRTF